MLRRSAAVRHASIGALCLLGVVTAAGNCASAAGLAFNLPAGHKATSLPAQGSYTETYEIPATGDSDAGCLAGFQKVGAIGITQDQLNAIAAKPEYAKTVQAFMGLQFIVTSTAPFEQTGVRGVMATGDARSGPVRMLLVILETPKGRTTISCVGPVDKFAALLPEFESIARGVVLPK